MAHIDFPPPSRKDMLDRLRPGDVLTHCYRPFPNAPVVRGEVRAEMLDARERGVIFDIGHGMGGFGFASTRPMLDGGLLPRRDQQRRPHPVRARAGVRSAAHACRSCICLGMPLGEVIAAATARPAEALRRPDLGTLAPGAAGDATVLELAEGAFDYVDVTGERLAGERRLEVEAMVLHGRAWPAQDTAP